MLRSMYSGISGLKNFQTKLDVVGNNIANVNTFGYKKGRVTFKDLVSQSVGSSSGAGGNVGGTNPKQVGLGASMSTVDNVYNQGALQNTGRVLDVGISGEGFFQVVTAEGIRYTRSGNFYTDLDGNLVTGDGNYVVGTGTQGTTTVAPTVPLTEWGANVAGAKKMKIPSDARNLSIGKDGLVTYVDTTGALQNVGYITMANFANPGGLEKSGVNVFAASQNSGGAVLGTPNVAGMGQLTSGTLEMSNVDLSEEFTEMIIAQRGFQANTRIITTSDQVLEELVNLKR
ncbi:flagellar basal body rod protein FlgG [Exiguobacterium acetylicum]|uniref:flagellar basal body rod protein FlgG n=1 Tax=Exiguobacterium acetylicum TaxID=41170 RepID=UPI001CA677BA|nr:flagellar basal body rod protein FlgG [Exiguobacterium acetylicum]QZY85716.1 flagellar basal body rod protein FlgG [Exiguobacterium acetylicum]